MGKLPIRKISGYILLKQPQIYTDKHGSELDFICVHPCRSVAKDQIVRQQQRADSNTRVCYVERGPMIVAGVQDDEIDHIAESKTISQVSENAGEQQRTCTQNAIVVSRCAHEVIKNRDRSEHCEHDEEPATERAAFLQLSKRDARVFGVYELKEPGNDHAFVTEAQRFNRPRFRRLVGHKNAQGRQQIAGAPSKPRA